MQFVVAAVTVQALILKEESIHKTYIVSSASPCFLLINFLSTFAVVFIHLDVIHFFDTSRLRIYKKHRLLFTTVISCNTSRVVISSFSLQ